jgi:hypothetical protein
MNKSELLDMLRQNLTVRVPAAELFDMVDHFWDSGEPDSPDMDAISLMALKVGECGDEFVENITEHGVARPCQVYVEDDRLYFEDGHHRMAIALAKNMSVPVYNGPSSANGWPKTFYYD